jgi:hypothetical protein
MRYTSKKLVCGSIGLFAFMFSIASSHASNLLVNGDFSSGNTGFGTDYTLTTMSPFLFQNAVHGIYAILPANAIAASSAYGDWTNISTDPTGGHGNVFVADGATTPNTTVWKETVNVTPNTNYTFKFYAAEVSNPCCSNATILPAINGVNGSVLATNATWQRGTVLWNSGASVTATILLTDTNTSGPFNDFAIGHLDFSPATATTPLPAALPFFGAGLAGLGWLARRRRLPA